MEFYEAIRMRRTVRSWSDKPISESTLKRILNAGFQAPSHNHLRNWEFIVIKDIEEKERALQGVKAWASIQDENRMVSQNACPAQQMFAYAMPRQYTMLKDASYLVIPVFKADSSLFCAKSVAHMNSFASIWCVIENIFLAAAAEGAGCSMRIPWETEGDDVCRLLGIPKGYVMPCYIGIGFPNEEAPVLPQHTFDIEDKIHFGKW